MSGPVPRPRPDGSDSDGSERSSDAPRDPARDLLTRLARGSRGFERFEIEGSVGEGGMGIVLRVRDPELNRTLALKRIKPLPADPPPVVPAGARPPDPARRTARFLDEAQVTARLDHPGVIPVHELGLDPAGQPYFTMKLVRGTTLQEALVLAREGRDGWSTTRAVGVLLRICEAMSYAHALGVVHRDLKPANVMLGRFGEVYVMDWGLARVFGASEGSDAKEFADLRHGGSGESSQEVTEDGEVFGTPPYMSPEQATGELHAVGPLSDVYAVGAILYELLAGGAPFTSPESPTNNRWILARLRRGPPPALEKLARSAPPELVAICRHAMEREEGRRYASMTELADDLRAYLELRVVRAYGTGPIVELRKWIARNRGVAATALAGLALVTASGFVVAREQSERAARNAKDVWELGVLELGERSRRLSSGSLVALSSAEAWLGDAREAFEKRDACRAELDSFLAEHAGSARIPDPTAQTKRPDGSKLRALEKKLEIFTGSLAKPEHSDAEDSGRMRYDADVLRAELADLPRAIAREQYAISAWRDWRFADSSLAMRHERLEAVCAALEELGNPDDGRIAWVAHMLASARAPGANHTEAWAAAQREIADPTFCPAYGGKLSIEPQVGLVPLGRDPDSKLYEFWHVPSGERPRRRDSGDGWAIRPETGIVLILVPGGAATVGAQQSDPDGPNYVPPVDGEASVLRAFEHRPVTVELDPYLLSRYELTQGQWLRLSGTNPSEQFAGSSRVYRRPDRSTIPLPRWSRVHPVESVSWIEFRDALALWGLEMPTEVQWEYAARAGRDTAYVSGNTLASLAGVVNDYDELTRTSEAGGITDAQFAAASDRWPYHAPVDAFPPNAWGFHSISGNVEELCRDGFGEPCDGALRLEGTGENQPPFWWGRAVRGGSYRSGPGELRLSRRYAVGESSGEADRGVRPACRLESKPKGP